MAGLVPAIHVFASHKEKTWMPGTRPGMTSKVPELDSVDRIFCLKISYRICRLRA